MRLEIRFRHHPADAELEEVIRARVRAALDRIELRVSRFEVTLVGAMRGMVTCQISTHVLPDIHLDVSARDVSTHAAVDLGIKRAVSAIERSLDRALAARRSAPRMHAPADMVTSRKP